tara:strand:- start:9410 stop:9859 length:450 start_codon:yes stop_codon:yes gene_type:complete
MKLRISSFILLILLITSCTPQRRFMRLIEKHPHLLTTDTITIHDTVIFEIPSVIHDTVFTEHFFTEITKDTLILQKERLTVKIFHDTIKKSIYVYGECDTVIVEKIIERKIPVKYYEKTPLWKKILNWLIIAVIIYTVYRLIIFVKKKI